MDINISNFRAQASSRWFGLNREIVLDDEGKVCKGQSCLASRIRGWGNGQVDDTRSFDAKQAFAQALLHSEGQANARRAIEAAGLPKDWEKDSQPLTSRNIRVILDKAQENRQKWQKSAEKEALKLMKKEENGPYKRDLDTEVRYGLRGLDYTEEKTPQQAAEAVYKQARNKVQNNSALLCKERFPGLSVQLEAVAGNRPLHAATLIHEIRESYAIDTNSIEGRALSALEQTTQLLGEQAWNQQAFQTLDNKLQQHRDALTNQLTEINSNIRESEEEKPLLHALQTDLERQINLLDAKQDYLHTVRDNDALSGHELNRINRLWAEIAQQILKDTSNNSTNDSSFNKKLETAGKIFDARATVNYKETLSLPAPKKNNKKSHLVIRGQKKVLDDLEKALSRAGLDKDQIKALMSPSNLKKAYTTVLARSPEWLTIERDMLVVRDGAARTYHSTITPAQHWDGHFKKAYTVAGQLQGVTSREAANMAHARNLKVSQLSKPGEEKPLMTVVGHGVLDMWRIGDSAARQEANKKGAREVLELALASNPRLKASSLKASSDTPTKPPRMVHVSVNLTSPDMLRSSAPFKHLKPNNAEKNYTRAQFSAFASHAGHQELGCEQNGEEAKASIEVDPITFSFGINVIATKGQISALMGGVWRNVHEHNRANMIKLLGDLGQGKFGARGTLPGGFIGEVYDRLKNAAKVPGISQERKAGRRQSFLPV